MTHLLYLTAILLVGLYCEGRGYARGMRDTKRRYLADGTLGVSTVGGFIRIDRKPEPPSTIKTRHIDGTITEHNIDSFGNEKPSPSTL